MNALLLRFDIGVTLDDVLVVWWPTAIFEPVGSPAFVGCARTFNVAHAASTQLQRLYLLY